MTPAPNFTLKNQNGQDVSLHQFKGKKNVILYFYPKDNTPGCTAEACSFRDAYEDFQDLGAEVIGVSQDSSESHQQFSQNKRLPFILLSDGKGEVAKAYNVKKTLGLIPERVTFVIDKQGMIRHRFSSQLRATKHVSEALDILQKLSN